MIKKEIQLIIDEIYFCLSERKLKPAFDLLGNLITNYQLVQYADECRNLEQTYHYMLQYTVDGANDPERQKVYRRLIVSVYVLADKIYEALRLKFSSSFLYQKKRNFQKLPPKDLNNYLAKLEDYYAQIELESLVNKPSDETANELKDALEHQQQVVSLFYHFWFNDTLVNEEIRFLTDFFKSPVIISAYKALVITAISLSQLRYFDPKKKSVLFDAFESDDPEIRQRSIVGVLINLYKYDNRMPFYPEITGRLEILSENSGFKKNLEQIIIQFIRTRETEKLQQKIKDELIPEMIKISPNLKNKINLDSLMEEGLTDDKNPEWEEIFKDSPGLLDKMEEFSELQMEGADVFLSSFSMLKSFPFFTETANWLIPYFPDNPEIISAIDTTVALNNNILQTIHKAPILCNSDKYSFCFSINNIPEENREMMAAGMKAEMDQFNEIGKDEELTKPGRNDGFISNQYIQDLYRFYKINPHKAEMEDVFEWRFDFYNKYTFQKIFREENKTLRNIAEFYFVKNYFSEASEIYSFLLEEEKSGELYQKIAFCYQKQGLYKKALEAYLKADLYELNKLWNLKKIALCYRNLKEPSKALDYYQQAEKLDTKNLSIHLSIGHCYLELKEYNEALKCYFKVEYLSPGNSKVWRPIGWCSFLTGKVEQAEKYFNKLLNDNPTKYDLMNMGHVQWALNNRKQALYFYKQSIGKTGFSEVEFINVFDEDLHHLLNQGINNDDVPIMLDQLRYFLEE